VINWLLLVVLKHVFLLVFELLVVVVVVVVAVEVVVVVVAFEDAGCGLGFVPPREHNRIWSMVGIMALVEAAAIDPPPLRLDESDPVPFESTPIKSASSIRYRIVVGF